ncbi:MAG: tetratricopeptide repeat protein [Bacteroidales bacterium]|nr:tetratricopeptide repeat protein [Bacteroidales bacterium]
MKISSGFFFDYVCGEKYAYAIVMFKISLTKTIVFIIGIIVPIQLSAQIDSLQNVIKTSDNLKEIGKTYNKLADKFLDLDMQTSRQYADSALMIGQRSFNYEIISDAYVNLANYHFFQGELDSALIFFEMSYQSILKSRNKNEIAAALNRLGLIYESKSDYSTAAEYYYKALKIYEDAGYTKGKAEIYNNLGVISDALGHPQKALENYVKSLTLFEEAKIIEGQANVYNNIATLYANENKTDTAIMYVTNSIRILMQGNRLTEAATAYFNAAVFYNLENNNDSAEICLDSALMIFTQTNNIHGIANVYSEKAKKLIELKDYNNAITLLIKSLEFRKEVGNLSAESQTLLQLSEFYSLSGDYENALNYYKSHIVLEDSVFNENTKNIISELSIKYETEKKDKEITILRKEAEIKKNHNRLLILIVTALAIILILLFYFFRIKSRLLISQRKYYEQQDRLNQLEMEQQVSERQLLEQEVQIQQQINEIQKSKFEAELDHSKRELITTTMQVLNKNKTLTEIQDYLETLSPKSIEEKKVYRELSKMVKQNINLDTDWEQLKIHFDKVNTGFFEKLQNDYPELSQGDLKVLAYIKIKLSSKEIAQMMNISPAGINKRLYRIRRKMNLPTHANIGEYLEKI